MGMKMERPGKRKIGIEKKKCMERKSVLTLFSSISRD
jgi:hypothetical protein